MSQEKEIEDIQIGKEDIKLSSFADDMIIYVQNPKESTKKKKKFLELISDSSKVSGHKVNIRKSIVFLYTNNKLMEFEI